MSIKNLYHRTAPAQESGERSKDYLYTITTIIVIMSTWWRLFRRAPKSRGCHVRCSRIFTCNYTIRIILYSWTILCSTVMDDSAANNVPFLRVPIMARMISKRNSQHCVRTRDSTTPAQYTYIRFAPTTTYILPRRRPWNPMDAWLEKQQWTREKVHERLDIIL